MSDDRDPAGAGQARLLGVLLAINAAMFVVELVAGVLADSAGLLADSLDMLADAAVYGIGLYAVGRAAVHKARAALASGIFQLAIGVDVLLEVVRRFVFGSEPMAAYMVAIGALALAANLACLALLSKHRHGEVHMRASWIFSTNDVLANLGVMAAGGLVAQSGSRLPDLVIGALIAALVVRGGVRIIAEARRERAAAA